MSGELSLIRRERRQRSTIAASVHVRALEPEDVHGIGRVALGERGTVCARQPIPQLASWLVLLRAGPFDHYQSTITPFVALNVAVQAKSTGSR